MLEYKGLEVCLDGDSSLRVSDGDFTVAVDPGSSSPVFDAALVLLTDGSGKGVDRKKLKEVCGRSTCVVVPPSLGDADIPCQDVEIVKPGEMVDIFGVRIEAMGSDSSLSYRFEMRKASFFASGDFGLSEEVIRFENTVDLAFLAAGEVELEDVVRTAVRLKPEVAVPYRYGGNPSVNLDNLKADLEDRNIKCKILE